MLKANYTLIFLSLFSFIFTCSCSSTQTELPQEDMSWMANLKLTPSSDSSPTTAFNNVNLLNYTYTRNKAMFSPQNIRLGSQQVPKTGIKESSRTNKGTHLHLSIDNNTYYISNENIFDCPIPNGRHKIFAFIASPYFESIKMPQAILAKEIEVRNGELVKSKNLPQVDIVYNVPSGIYKKEEADKVLLDFVLVNTTIGKETNKVKITVNNTKEFIITQWSSFYLEGLIEGNHDIKLELLDNSGKQIAAPVYGSFVFK